MFFYCIYTALLLDSMASESISESSFLGPRHCYVRYDLLHAIKDDITCENVVKLNPICGRDIKVLFSESAPYIHTDTAGEVHGVLSNFLKEILIEHCCLGCNNITFLPSLGVIEKFKTYLSNNNTADIVLPVENGRHASVFYGNPYISLIQISKVLFIRKDKKVTNSDLLDPLLHSTLLTWPLAVIAIAMAVCAGTIIWMMDTWFNRHQFPRSFPKGPFEGFWWAFVSMTTVGYGDRTPHSVAARLFAVCWIFSGIIVFNMFTATITSSLTLAMKDNDNFDVYKENVGVLGHSTATNVGVLQENAKPKHYENIDLLISAYEKKEIYAIAMEDLEAFYYLEEVKRHDPSFTVKMTTKLEHNALGLVSNSNIIGMLKTFFESNQDSRSIMTGRSLYTGIYDSNYSKYKIQHQHNSPFSPKHYTFYITVGTMLSCSLACILVNLLIRSKRCPCKRKTEVITHQERHTHFSM